MKSYGDIRVHSDWWMTVHCCRELGRYYRHIFNHFAKYRGYLVGETHWGPHISFVRGEEPVYWKKWEQWHETEVEFEFQPRFVSNGKHIWFPVKCNFLHDIRDELGLKRDLLYCDMHLTLGVYHSQHDEDRQQIDIPVELQ